MAHFNRFIIFVSHWENTHCLQMIMAVNSYIIQITPYGANSIMVIFDVTDLQEIAKSVVVSWN